MPEGTAVIIVHTPEQVKAAFEAAAALHISITLQSAPHAIAYAGSLYLLRMFEQVKDSYPAVDALFILDCGDNAAEAIAAMQMGHMHLRSSAADAVQAKLSDIASQLGATIVTAPYTALDLSHQHDLQKSCREWLLALE